MTIFKRNKIDKLQNTWKNITCGSFVGETYYTYFNVRLDFPRGEKETYQTEPVYEIWSGVKSKVCWIGAGSSGLYVPCVRPNNLDQLATQLFFHEIDVNQQGFQVTLKNEVPSNQSHIISSLYSRRPLSEEDFLELAGKMHETGVRYQTYLKENNKDKGEEIEIRIPSLFSKPKHL